VDGCHARGSGLYPRKWDIDIGGLASMKEPNLFQMGFQAKTMN
jgi:hypothetical protein